MKPAIVLAHSGSSDMHYKKVRSRHWVGGPLDFGIELARFWGWVCWVLARISRLNTEFRVLDLGYRAPLQNVVAFKCPVTCA